jgi:hypothetical protein
MCTHNEMEAPVFVHCRFIVKSVAVFLGMTRLPFPWLRSLHVSLLVEVKSLLYMIYVSPELTVTITRGF